MGKYRMCMTCGEAITKGARSALHMCRSCEQEMKELKPITPIYHPKFQ